MGYMGFGMQKWIYNQRPRKPFSKRRISTGNTIDKFSANDLIITGRTNKNQKNSNINTRQVLNRIRQRSVKSKIFSITISLTIIIILAILFVKYKPWIHVKYSEKEKLEELQRQKHLQSETFNLAINYGNHHFKNGDIDLAIIEYSNALLIYPDSIAALNGLIQAYVKDCLTNEKNCEKAISLVERLTIEYPENIDYISYKIHLENKNNK